MPVAEDRLHQPGRRRPLTLGDRRHAAQGQGCRDHRRCRPQRPGLRHRPPDGGARRPRRRCSTWPAPSRPPPRRSSAPGHLGLVADVTDKASCEAAAAAVLKAFGRIDILVNNAGITQPAKTLRHHRRRLRPHPRRQPARHAVHVAGRAAGDAARRRAARSSASRRSRRSAAAASSAARTTRPPRPACSAWRVRWRASSASTASASTASRRA